MLAREKLRLGSGSRLSGGHHHSLELAPFGFGGEIFWCTPEHGDDEMLVAVVRPYA